MLKGAIRIRAAVCRAPLPARRQATPRNKSERLIWTEAGKKEEGAGSASSDMEGEIGSLPLSSFRQGDYTEIDDDDDDHRYERSAFLPPILPLNLS